MKSKNAKKVRVCIVGAAGLLGSRLFSTIKSHISDLEVTVGVYKSDESLERIMRVYGLKGETLKNCFPEKIYLDESPEEVFRVNEGVQGKIKFCLLQDLDLNSCCDVVIHASPLSLVMQEKYKSFKGSIILQSGQYPRGSLVIPPIVPVSKHGNVYRQGSCFLNGVTPVLSVLSDLFYSVTMNLVMQNDKPEKDFVHDVRLNSFSVEHGYTRQYNKELNFLFPDKNIELDSVIQIPGMLHYAVTMKVKTLVPVSKEEVFRRLKVVPRVFLMLGISGTYEVNLARTEGQKLPPILVLGDSLLVKPDGREFHLTIAIFYKTIAILPQIDAIRMLIQNMHPLDAMRKTDSEFGI